MSKVADMPPAFVPFGRHDPEQSIVARFSEHALERPAHPAIEACDEILTYAELDCRSNRIANILLQHRNQSAGANPVALLFGHNISMVISMLGVLKAGKSYLPLDPRYPAARLKQILENAQSQLLLTENEYEKNATVVMPQAAAVMNIARIAETVSQVHPNVVIDPGQVAYILYTSGSTGSPKGVIQSHRNVLSNIRNYTNDIHIGPSDRLSLLSSFSFAASVSDLYGGLMNGATVCLFDLQRDTIQSCVQWLQRKRITIHYSVPSVFRLLVSALNEKDDLPDLRVIKLGGDSISYSDCQLYRARFSDRCILLISLGATEINLICRFIVDKNTELLPGIIPVGSSPDDVELFLVDENGNPVPRGTIGELIIRSPHLALGYWNESENSGSRLVQDSHNPNQRMFKSGDLGRFLDDGSLLHLGRSDSRVKVNGQAVSLLEIETVLSDVPTVHEAVVVAKSDQGGNNRLIAYIVGERGSPPSIEDLRKSLTKRLPLYMVPAGFVFLDAFPLTHNGKVDRRRLLVEDQRSSLEEGTYIAPRNTLEGQLTKIWETVLGRQPIGITDNFFYFGGDSLIAVRLCAEIEQTLQMRVSVPLLFQAQTIEQLAEKIGCNGQNEPLSLLVPIQSNGANPPIYCVGFGSNFRRHLQNYPNQPLYMFLNQGDDGRPVLHTTVEEIATLCLKDLRMVQPAGPYYLAGYSFHGMVAYEMAQQLQRQGETIGLLALVDPPTGLFQSAPTTWGKQLAELFMSSTSQEPKWLPRFLMFSHALLKKALAAPQWRAKRLKSTSRIGCKIMICKVYFGFGYPLPLSLRRFYRDRVHTQAARQYIPQDYHGGIVLFQTSKNVENYWRKLCVRVEQVYNLPCKHLDIFLDGSHTPMLLDQLLYQLERARKNWE